MMEAFRSDGLKVNLGNTMVMVSSSITQNGLSKSNVGACVVCSLRVRLTQNCVYRVVRGSVVDVPE